MTKEENKKLSSTILAVNTAVVKMCEISGLSREEINNMKVKDLWAWLGMYFTNLEN